MFDWDDLRVFVEAARTGSLAAAGERLGMDPATVGRRLARLESALKSTLVVRSRTGLQLTAAGVQLFELGLNAETAMHAAANVVQSDVAAGTVRISTSEGFGTAVLAAELPSLAQSRRGLRIELAATAGFLSPSRREVDMAITLSPPEAGRLVVEPLARYQLALYAAPQYLDRSGRPTEVEDIKALDLVGYVDDLLYAPELRYLDQVLPGLAPRLASSSIRAQQAIIAAGGGVGVLPGFLAEGLEPVLPDKVLIERRFWLSTHKDVHMTARMRAVRQWLQDVIVRKQRQLCPWGPAD